MKHLLVVLSLIVVPLAHAQTNLRSVMADTNGAIVRPTNVLSSSARGIVSSTAPVRVFSEQWAHFANGTTEASVGSFAFTNGSAVASVSQTNAGVASARLIAAVNSEPPQGAGTMFGNDSHTIWVRFDAVPQQNGTMRVVLGNSDTASTNIAAYPTNRAIGFELRRLGGDTNEVRLIAHNGTTNTNGPWVALGTLFRRYTIGVEQNKTNGQVRLWTATSMASPAVNTNATITGGPTNNAAGGFASLVFGVATTNTNSGNAGATIYSAVVHISD